MVHKFPRIRVKCAEELYKVVVVAGEEGEGGFRVVKEENKVDKVCDLLLETIWDADVEVVEKRKDEDEDEDEEADIGVRMKRNELAELMGVELSEKCLAGKGKRGERKKKVEEMVDEHESYRSLVDTAGF